MSSSVHVDNKKKDILIFCSATTNRLDDATLTGEKEYSIDFTDQHKRFCLRLHHNAANGYVFVNGAEILEFKEKD